MNSHFDRREFLKHLGHASSAAFAIPLLSTLHAGCATGLASYRATQTDGQIILDLDEYPILQEIGGAIEIELLQSPDNLIIVRTSEKSVTALSPECTHLGCTVRKEPSFFRCPCHGSTYDLEGQVVRGPAERALDRYQAQLDENRVVITLEIMK
jgi:Rieske Fe-S protein